MGGYMDKKEEFKEFLKKNPHLSYYVNEGATTYQKLFETFDIYGSDSSVWNSFKGKTVKEESKLGDGVKNILGNLKNVDLDKLEDNISSLEKALGFLEEIMSSRSEKKEEKKEKKKRESEIERFFDD